ncbi:MAG: hypothetical protein IJ489_00350 [Clostridia bacterium]|nr:hypothetical protein [Clostridia bacterium]
MVKKKIRKFFNSVPITERMPILFEEQKKKNFPFLWVATSFGIVISAVFAIWLVTRDSE